MRSMLKVKPWRSDKYKLWVREQPCVVTGKSEVEPHHIIGHGFSGMGTKAPDWALIPLHYELHRELHHIGFKAWENIHGNQMFLFMEFWRQSFDEIQEFINEN